MLSAVVTEQDLLANGVDPELYRQLTQEGHWLDSTIPQFVRETVRSRPNDRAFESLSQGRTVTWSQYLDNVLNFLSLFRELGITESDRVILCLPDWIENHTVEDALTEAGAITVRALLSSSDAELQRMSETVRAVAIVTPAQWRSGDFPALIRGWVANGSSLRHHLIVDGGRTEVVSFGAAQAGRFGAERGRAAHEVYLMTFTSGSTAQPKCVRHTSLRWVYMSRCIIDALEITESDSSLCLAPHSSGLGIWGGHTLPIVAGIRSSMIERFNAEEALSAIETAQPTILVVVPAQLIKMLDSPTFDPAMVATLRAIMFAGSSLPYERAREAEERFGCPVLTVAGSSDSATFIRAKLADSPEHRLHGWGAIAPGTTARLIATDGREIEGAHQEGMLAARGGFWSSGYFEDEEATRSIYCPGLPGWQVTGDVWIRDDEGYCRIVGRLKDIVIRGGQNISCAEVEEYVARHPAVSQVAAVKMADPVLGERVCAYVVLKAGRSLGLDDLLTFLESEGVAKYKLPERLELVADMPVSPAGKVLKTELEKDIEEKIKAGV